MENGLGVIPYHTSAALRYTVGLLEQNFMDLYSLSSESYTLFIWLYLNIASAVCPVIFRWQSPVSQMSASACRLVPAGCLQLCLQCF